MDPIGFDHRIKDLQSRRIAASMLIDEMEREAGIIDNTLRFSDWVAFQEDILTCVSTLLQQYAESRRRGENVDNETKVNTVIYQPLFDLLYVSMQYQHVPFF